MAYRIVAIFIVVLTAFALTACGGGNSSSSSKVRLINATSNFSSIDLYIGDTRVSDAISTNSAGGYANLDTGERTINLKRAGSSTTSAQRTFTAAADTVYTVLAYNTGDTLKTAILTENERDPNSGRVKFSVISASTDPGNLDVYVTSNDVALNDAAALFSDIAGEKITGFSEFDRGTYRIRVTAAGDRTDVRLDLSNITFTDKQVYTLILTSSTGGVLVNAMGMTQKTTVAKLDNPSARVRLVSNAYNGAQGSSTALTINNTAVSSGMRAPTVGSYVLVPAGNQTVDLKVDGASINTAGINAVAGADYSLVVMGTQGSVQTTWLTDDNRPANNQNNAKLRLAHAVTQLPAGINLTADYSQIASNITSGQASSYTQLNSGTGYRLEVTTGVSSTALYSANDISLQAPRTYTLFMLGTATTPAAVLRRDR